MPVRNCDYPFIWESNQNISYEISSIVRTTAIPETRKKVLRFLKEHNKAKNSQ
ncbi:3044_t:CDS:2 [Funneliformis mosseae]|uniref:3044_t:CDS:1 n=1 Tax=Funneliformis mosseae TaxID=27381 RepID=A0A9N9FDD4_FUNMO|nr:3044_t:CDS:2 [Funneliformis mosseae]